MNTTTRKRMPPYASGFMYEDDLRIAMVYFGPAAWTAKKDINSRSVILPPDEPASGYDWRFLRGNTVVCSAMGPTEHDYRRRLALELLLAGATSVMMMLPKEPVVLCKGTGFDLQLDEYIRPKEVYVHNRRR